MTCTSVYPPSADAPHGRTGWSGPLRCTMSADHDGDRCWNSGINWERPPRRLQRQRTAGWRKPAGAVYVGRPTVFGNPFAPRVIPGWATDSRRYAAEHFARWLQAPDLLWRGPFPSEADSVAAAAALTAALPTLAGRDLLCWCPPGQPCHADVLLEVANG